MKKASPGSTPVFGFESEPPGADEVTEAIDFQRPAERARCSNGKRGQQCDEQFHWQRKVDQEAEGTAGMDDRGNDGRGA